MSKDTGIGHHIRSEANPLSNVPDPCKHRAGIISRVGTAWKHPESYKPDEPQQLVEGDAEKSSEALDRMRG